MIRQGSNRHIVKFLTALMFCCHSVFSFEKPVEETSRQEILNLLQQWTKNFNDKNIEAACGLFAPDLLASYPGTADRNYEDMCRFLTAALTDKEKAFSYEAPHIEQIIIDGNIGVVRLIWNLKISHKDGLRTERIEEKGLDVFKRQKDGSWKIVISYAYPATKGF